jgi:1-phosphatidylinositol-3-phosphate 5-kinase
MKHSKKLLRAAIFNDTLFLQRNDVMDYSLMVAVDEVIVLPNSICGPINAN